MGLFDTVGTVKASRDSSYIKPGRYIALINRVKKDKNRANVDFVAIEMRILKALAFEAKVKDEPPTWGFLDISQLDPKMKLDALPHAADEEASHLILFNTPMALPNFKAFVRDVVGCKENEITPADCEALVSDVQPLSGRVVELRAKTIITREKKQPFTRISYGNALSKEDFLDLCGADFPLPPEAAWRDADVEMEAPTHAAEDAKKA